MNMTVQLTRSKTFAGTENRPTRRPVQLTRTFVETGDERCPIAGIWSRIECDPLSDDPQLAQPAMRRLLSWRAFHTLLTMPRYSLA
jgi:hypothetical protein